MIMLVPKRDDVTREWGKLHNEELNDLYSSPNIVQVIKSRSMIWVGHVTHTRKRIGIYRFVWGEREHLEYPGIDGRIILRSIFRKWDEGVWTRTQPR
jgi:hypothetical protein